MSGGRRPAPRVGPTGRRLSRAAAAAWAQIEAVGGTVRRERYGMAADYWAGQPGTSRPVDREGVWALERAQCLVEVARESAYLDQPARARETVRYRLVTDEELAAPGLPAMGPDPRRT